MTNALRIIHLSDFHFDGSAEVRTALDVLMDQAQAREPDLVVVTGDLTANGREEEMAHVQGVLDRFGSIPCLVLAGNRDVEPTAGPPGESRSLAVDSDLDYFLALEPALSFGFSAGAPGRSPEERFEARFGALEPAYRDERIVAVAINSTPRLRPESLERSAARLHRAAPTALRVFALHHGLLPVPGRKLRDGDLAARAGDLLALLCDLQVDLVLHGHIHRAHVWQVSNGHHRLVVASAGALVNDGRRDASFGEVVLNNGKLEVWRRSASGGTPLLLYDGQVRG